MIFQCSLSPTPTSTVRGHAGVWVQHQPQQCAPPKRFSERAFLAPRLTLHELWCAESTPEDVDPLAGDDAVTPVFAHGACVGPMEWETPSFYGAPPARPFSQPANLPGSVERGASSFS